MRLRVGERVDRGQFLGMAGDTGTSSVHLHFQVMVPGPNPFPGRFPEAELWYAVDPFGVYDRVDANHYMFPWRADQRIRGIDTINGWRSSIPLRALPTYRQTSLEEMATLLL